MTLHPIEMNRKYPCKCVICGRDFESLSSHARYCCYDCKMEGAKRRMKRSRENRHERAKRWVEEWMAGLPEEKLAKIRRVREGNGQDG